MHDLNGALFLKTFLIILSFALVLILIVPFTTVYASLQSRKYDPRIIVKSLLTEY